MVAILQIPIGMDKNFFHLEEHANFGAVAGFSISLTSISLSFLYIFWAAGLAAGTIAKASIIWGRPMLLYLAAVALSFFSAEVRMLALADLWVLMHAYAIFFYLVNRCITQRDLVYIVVCLATAMLIQGSIMIAQRAIGESLWGQRFYYGPVSFEVWEDGRTAGTLMSAVLAGSMMAIIWLVVFPVFMVIRNQKLWVYLGITLLVGMVGLLFTQTRGAVVTVGLGVIAIAGLMFIRGWLPKWFVPMTLAATLVAAYPLVKIIEQRVVSGDGDSAISRVHLTAIALETIPKKPIFGYGAGNCHLACLPVADQSLYRSEWYFTIHCKYLVVWIETGLIGLVAFLAILFNAFRQGLGAWALKQRGLSTLGMGCVAAIAGHMVHMFVDIFNSLSQVHTLWIVLAVTALTFRLATEQAERELRAEWKNRQLKPINRLTGAV